MPTPVYVFKRTPQFKRAFDSLSVEDQKAAVVHLVHSSQKGCVSAEHRDETTEEDHFATVTSEEISGDLQLCVIKSDVVPEAPDKGIATLVSDPIPTGVAENCRCGADDEDHLGRETMGRSRVDGRGDERGFTWHRRPQTASYFGNCPAPLRRSDRESRSSWRADRWRQPRRGGFPRNTASNAKRRWRSSQPRASPARHSSRSLRRVRLASARSLR